MSMAVDFLHSSKSPHTIYDSQLSRPSVFIIPFPAENCWDADVCWNKLEYNVENRVSSHWEWDEVHKYTTVNRHRGLILYTHVCLCFYVSLWKYNEVTGGLRTAHSNIVSNSERLTCVSHYVALFRVLRWRVINAQVAVSTCQSSVNRRCLCLRDLVVKRLAFISTFTLTRDMQEKHQTTASKKLRNLKNRPLSSF